MKVVKYIKTLLLMMVQNGEVEIVPGASISDKRKAFSHFSDSYRDERFKFYVRADEHEGFPKTMKSIMEAEALEWGDDLLGYSGCMIPLIPLKAGQHIVMGDLNNPCFVEST